MSVFLRFCLLATVALSPGPLRAFAQQPDAPAAGPEAPADAAADEKQTPAGHSYHGEAFNEGPRQKAYLMEGTGRVRFPVTTADPRVQQFIEQGVGQLHGFWYLEAERSFRQAAALDPECAMAYWGMARANINNEKRAKQFTEEAVRRKEGITGREAMYIDALDAFYKADASKKKERGEAYVKALERIVYKHPDDIEARAFIALQLWLNRGDGSPVVSPLAVDALLKQVLAVEPMHPCHHYVIHLWDTDRERAELALESAALCGQSAPAIAHMWHMPGHIYSRLRRYADAAWQQEASARVDHAHMIRDRVLPDQIHNFAHNNEWLIRNLMQVGRTRDALDLAKNMLELPRHPKYNTLRKGSAHYGRMRLFEVLARYELWDELVALAETPYLEPTEDEAEQVKRLRALGVAHFRRGDCDEGQARLTLLEEILKPHVEARDAAVAEAEAKVRAELSASAAAQAGRGDEEAPAPETSGPQPDSPEETLPPEPAPAESDAPEPDASDSDTPEQKDAAADDAEPAEPDASPQPADLSPEDAKKVEKVRKDAEQPFRARIDRLQKAIDELKGHLAVAQGDYREALSLFKKAGGVDQTYVARVHLLAGDAEQAEKTIRDCQKNRQREVQPLAHLVEVLWQLDKRDEAGQVFDELRGLSAHLDLDAPCFARLAPIAAGLGHADDWRADDEPAGDVGERPCLDSLGPFRWRPSPAPGWTLADADGDTVSLDDYHGRPVVLVFYLGHGCLHCVEQLQKFGPKADEFAEAGLSLVAVSTDGPDELRRSHERYGGDEFPFPLVSDDALEVFRAYRAYDDFESQPLHGTFVIDGDGLVRWQDIGHEPFMDPEFVLNEARRLLAQPPRRSNVE